MLLDDVVLTVCREKKSETEAKEPSFSERFYGKSAARLIRKPEAGNDHCARI